MAVSIVYNIEEVETILKPKGISKTSLYRSIKSGKLKAIKLGKRYIVSEKALNYFLEGNSYIESEID